MKEKKVGSKLVGIAHSKSEINAWHDRLIEVGFGACGGIKFGTCELIDLGLPMCWTASVEIPMVDMRKVWSSNLAMDVFDYCDNDESPKASGWVYFGGECFIEDCSKWPDVNCKWYLRIANEEWLSDDLESLEAKVLVYALTEEVAFVEGARS